MRIFWLSMHKVLIQTELPRLRMLGYEVFCPRCFLNDKMQQSAANGWTPEQKTTLPQDAFDQLSSFNFFSDKITSKIAHLLNEHFDVVIVTIDPGWLLEILRVYKKKVIFRTYGHIVNISHHLFLTGGLRPIIERDNFWHVPHAAEAIEWDDDWFKERLEFVPYCVLDETAKERNTWNGSTKEIMITCPNIANPFYADHFKYLKSNFGDSFFRYYGVQTSDHNDPNLVGTIPYPELMTKFKNAAGYLHTYKNPSICFLPPIEMMVVGGPVIYFKGSLLSKYFGDKGPGCANNEAEAKEKCLRLLNGDLDFINSVIASQDAILKRYMPNDVWIEFDKVFKRLLSPQTQNKGQRIYMNLDEFKDLEKKEAIKGIFIDNKEQIVGLRSKLSKGTYIFTYSYFATLLYTQVRNLNVKVVIIDKDFNDSPEVRNFIPDQTMPILKRAFIHPLWFSKMISTKIKKTLIREKERPVSKIAKDLKTKYCDYNSNN